MPSEDKDRGLRFVLAWCGAFLVCLVWFRREWCAQGFHVQGRTGQPELDVVQLGTFLAILVVVSVVAGLLARGSREVDRWRIVMQGVTVPGLLVTAMTATTEKLPAAGVVGSPTPVVTGQRLGSEPPPSTWAGFSLVASAYALTSDPSTRGGEGQAGETRTLEPPGLLTRIAWGAKGATGRYVPNWQVELGRFRARDEAVAAARSIGTAHHLSAATFELCFAGANGNEWSPCSPDTEGIHSEYAVLLAVGNSPAEASRVKAAAEKVGLAPRAWQTAARVFPIQKDGALPVDRLGAHVVRSRGAALSIAVDASYAAEHAGARWFLLAVALSAGTSSSGVVDRHDLVLVSPEGQGLPLASQAALGADVGDVVRTLRAFEIVSGSVGEYLTGRSEECEWFLGEPTTGLVVDTVSIPPGAVCEGFLAFAVPTGVTAGTWHLELGARGTLFVLPIEVENAEAS